MDKVDISGAQLFKLCVILHQQLHYSILSAFDLFNPLSIPIVREHVVFASYQCSVCEMHRSEV